MNKKVISKWVKALRSGPFEPKAVKFEGAKAKDNGPLYNLLVFVLTKEARKALDDGDIETAQHHASMAQMHALTIPSMSKEQMNDVHQLLVDINDAVRSEIAQVWSIDG